MDMLYSACSSTYTYDTNQHVVKNSRNPHGNCKYIFITTTTKIHNNNNNQNVVSRYMSYKSYLIHHLI